MGLSHKVRNLGLAIAVAGTFVLSACQSTPPVATPTHNSPDYPTNTPTAVYSPTPIPTFEETVQPNPTYTLEPSPTVTNSPVPTATFTPIPSPTPSPSPTPVPRYDVALSFFHDMNNSGVRDTENIVRTLINRYTGPEPIIPNLEVCLDNVNSGFCGTTDQNGSVYFQDVLAGSHSVVVTSDKFIYNPSSDAYLKLVSPRVSVNADTVQSFGLSEGAVILPIQCQDLGKVLGVMNYFDLDLGSGVRTWNGGPSYNGHDGTDFLLSGDVEIVAGLPDKVTHVGEVTRPSGRKFPNDYSIHVMMYGPFLPWVSRNLAFYNIYVHTQEVLVVEGQHVKKGDVIGWSRESLYPPVDDQHIHLGTFYESSQVIVVDPFKDPQNSDSHNLWSVFNDPACF